METGTKTLIFCFSLAVTILLCLFGCGKRVTSIDRIDIKKDSLNVSKHYEFTQNITWSDIGSIKPFDELKPMLINGKWYYNTIIEFDKSIKSGIEIKAGENLSYTSSEKSEKTKKTESDNQNLLWIGLTFVIGILFVLYLTIKKYTL